MKKAFMTVNHEELMKGEQPLIFFPFRTMTDDSGLTTNFYVAATGAVGVLLRTQTVIEDEDTIEVQSDSTVYVPNLALVESKQDKRLYLYDDNKPGARAIADLINDGAAEYEDLDLDAVKEQVAKEEENATQEDEKETGDEEAGYDRDAAASKIDNMDFSENEDPEEGDGDEGFDDSAFEPEPEENEVGSVENLEKELIEKEFENELGKAPEDEKEESGEKETEDETAEQLATRLREAGFNTTVKDGDKKITYVGADNDRTPSRPPYNKTRNENNHKKDGKNKKHNQNQKTVYRKKKADLDFDEIAKGIF